MCTSSVGTIEILQHKIEFRFEDYPIKTDYPLQTLDESSIEHIESQIKEGFCAGELCFHQHDDNNDKETTILGWWNIARCRCFAN